MEILYELAKVIQKNQEMEAQAVQGYTLQLEVISKARGVISQSDNADKSSLLSFLDSLESETEEKISDELNHEKGLLSEYVELTGIQINTD